MSIGALLAVVQCWGVPLDEAAQPHLELLACLLKQPVQKRLLSIEEAVKYTALLRQTRSTDVAACGALILAWADDQDSRDALVESAEKYDRSWAKRAISCALKIRDIRRTGKDYYTGLCDAVRAAKDPLTLLFLANRLWGDFGKRGLDVIYEATKTHGNDFVTPELVRYLSDTDSPALAEDVLKLENWMDAVACSPITDIVRTMVGPLSLRQRTAGEARRKLLETQKKK